MPTRAASARAAEPALPGPGVDAATLWAAFSANPLGMAVVEPAPDGRFTIIEANAALPAVLGCGSGGRGGTADTADPAGTDGAAEALAALLAVRPGSSAYSDGWQERRFQRPDGRRVWLRLRLTTLPVAAASPRLLLQLDDITERVEARQRSQRQARLLDLIPEPVIIRALDGTILYWNSGAVEIYGHPTGLAVGRRTHELLHTRFLDVTLPELEQQLGSVGSWSGQLEHRHADGHTLRMASKHVRDEHADGPPVILEINIDVTDRLAAEQALAASEAKFRSQFASSTVGQLIRHLDGTIDEVNQAMADMLGYRPDELVGTSVERIFSPSVAATRASGVAALVRGEIDAINGETVLTRADGSALDAQANVSVARGPDGRVDRIIGIFQDITARKVAEHALTYQASHDHLTGLANRSLLIDRITEALRETPGTTHTVGLLYLDLDGFKQVNDAFGHGTGDALLSEAGARLRDCVRGGDTVARLGGDEFVVLCPDLDTPARLHAVARRALTKLGLPYDLGIQHINTVTASVGLSYPTPGSAAVDALREADRAMYEAKRTGKNRIGLHAADEIVAVLAERRSA